MSVKFKMANSKTIFDQIPMAPTVLEKIHEILDSGWKLETGFNTVTMSSPKGEWTHTVTLPVGVPVILENPGKLSQAQKLVCGQTLVKLINITNDKWANVQTDATIEFITKQKLAVEKGMAELDEAADPLQVLPIKLQGTASKAFNDKLGAAKLQQAYKELTVMKLADAAVILQAVKGSDVGSVYRLIGKAANGMRIAARLSSTKLSIRVEGPRSDIQVAALKECGITGSPSGHSSGHYVLGSIAPARVLGAILFDPRLALTEWTEAQAFLDVSSV